MYSQKAVIMILQVSLKLQPISIKLYLDNENVSGDAVLWRNNESKKADGRHFEDC